MPRLVILGFLLSVSCKGTATGTAPPFRPDGGRWPDAGQSDAGADSGIPAGTLAGQVLKDLCNGLGGAQVQAVLGTSSVTADATGAFSLVAGSTSTSLQVTAPGYVQTNTFSLDPDAGALVRAYAVPQDVFDMAYALRHLIPDPTRGTLLVAVVDANLLPLVGASVGFAAGSPGTVDYVASIESPLYVFPGFDSTLTSTQPHSGAAAVFNAAPGDYALQVNLAGYTFPSPRFSIVPGAVTLGFVTGAGQGAASQAQITGTVSLYPVFPIIANSPAPAAGVTVTLQADPNDTPVSTVSLPLGVFSLSIPYTSRMADLTLSYPGYAPVRTARFCLNPFTPAAGFALSDSVAMDRAFLTTLGERPFDLNAGELSLAPVEADQVTSVTNARVSVTPDAGALFYGIDPTQPQACGRGPCQVGNACPSGQRCQNGECVLGATGPMCTPCVANACADGGTRFYDPWLPDGGGNACYCVPRQTDCLQPSPACVPGAYCEVLFLSVSPTQSGIADQYCAPQLGWQPDTHWGFAYAANLSPGTYTVTAQAPGKTFVPQMVRITPGVVAELNVPVVGLPPYDAGP